jgi:hypothetical protein
MARALPTGLVAALALLAAGCGSLDSPDLVHDLRLLAMRADPPDQVFVLPLYPDGGLDLGAALTPGALDVQPITVTALVADPDGGGRPIHYQYAICSELADGGRCDPADPNTVALAEGDLVPDGGWAELPVTFTPSLELLGAAVEQDDYHGFGYLPVPVQLHLQVPGDEVWGFKRLVFTLVLPGQSKPAPNTNPFVPAVYLDGALWSATAPPLLDALRDYDVSPLVPTGAEEAYSRPTFEGGEVDFTESWRFNFFATAGGFSSFSTGGSSIFATGDTPSNSTWTPKAEDGPQRVTYFIVVRDGRGGEGWTVRTAQYAPPPVP